jgi:adenosylcobinamide-GDP ribazoletransferase
VSSGWRGLGSAIAYYTVVPAGRFASDEAPDAASLAWLPPIGAVTGAIAGLTGWAAFRWLHVPWSFVLAWAVAVGLTGAVHVDGFLDACDGLLATTSPQRRLEILKDPRHGTFAVVAMAVAAAFWLAALAAIAPWRYPLVLAFSGAVARLAVMPNAWLFPYARPGAGVSRTFASLPSVVALVPGFLLVEALAWFVAPWALVVAPVAALFAWIGAKWSSHRLGGGLTGDVYGALIVATEVLVLLAIGIHPTS